MAERFSECLADLLEKKDTTGYELAHRMEIDTALIYKWLNDKAVPSLRSDHLEMIATKLDLTNEEKDRLEQAQIISLKNPPQHRRGKKPSIPPPGPPPRRGQPKGIRVISERPQALDAALELLEKLPDIRGKNSSPIFLTLQGETIFRSVPGFHERWQAARVQVLQRGWSIRHLWRFNFGVFRHVDWVNDILGAIAAGDYIPYFFNDQKGLYQPPYELFLLPDGPAMLFFATTSARNVDAAVLVESPEFIKVLTAHMNLLFEQTNPLLTMYPREERQSFRAVQENQEALLGGRLFVKKDFAGMTKPLSFFEGETPWTWVARLEGAAAWMLEHYTKRQDALRKTMEQTPYAYRDIHSKHAIEEFVRTGKYSPYQSVGPELQVEPTWVRQHIEHVITLLQQFDHYQMAFLTEEEERVFPVEPYWMVAGRQGAFSVFIETWYPDPTARRGKRSIDVQITEQRLVQAFMAHFDDFWRDIPAERKDKKDVIPWLKSLIQ